MDNNKKHSEGLPFTYDSNLSAVLLHAMPDAVVITDRVGDIVFVNEALQVMFDYIEKDLLGHPIEMLMPERFQEQHIINRKHFFFDRGIRSMGHGMEMFGQRSNGSEFPVEIALGTIEVEQGKFSLAYVTDITVRKDAEKRALENERLHAELEQDKELIKAKEQFLLELTHDLQNPLSTVMIATTLLERLTDEISPSLERNIHRIKQQIQLMQNLLQDTLVMGRSTSSSRELNLLSIDLKIFCHMVVENIRFSDKGEHNIHFSAEGNLQNAYADTTLLRRIFLNLLENAIKYSPEGSEIECKVSREGHEAIFHIIDHGIGIPEEEQAYLFKPFFRAANVRHLEGTGLGLVIVKNCVEQHGGTIEYESIEGLGTKFIIRLPLFKENCEQSFQTSKMNSKQENQARA